MEIRRKVFSLLQDENGEERYYSTTKFKMEFDEETGEKMFSEKEKEEKDVKLKTGDAINYYGNYGLIRKDGLAAKLERDRISGDNKKNIRNSAIGGGASVGLGMAAGAGLVTGSAKSAAKHGLIGATLGAGAGALGAAGGLALRHKIEKGEGKFAKNYKKSWEKQEDLLDLKQGKISKEEFVKKWGGKIDGKKIKGSKNED